ncbi:MAG: hypothetical protein ACK52V_06490 [Betaproteobacteria bacterium]|jgi:hypothetical protein
MPYPIKHPDPETFISENKEYRAKLYAELADIPLYAHVRLMAEPGLCGKRQSFWLGWIIRECRLAKGKDTQHLPDDLLEWITDRMIEAYPDHKTATGLSPAEVQQLEKEQAEKRKKRRFNN